MSDIPCTFKDFTYIKSIERGVDYLATCKAKLETAREEVQVELVKQKQVNGFVAVTTAVGHIGTFQRDSNIFSNRAL